MPIIKSTIRVLFEQREVISAVDVISLLYFCSISNHFSMRGLHVRRH